MDNSPKSISCSACGHGNEGSKQFCKSCGKWLNNVQSNIETTSDQSTNTPVAGCLSVLAIPVGIIFSIVLVKNVGVHDSWGLGIFLLIILLALVTAFVGLILGAFAVIPGKDSTKQSTTNSTLGVVGIVFSFAVILIILILFKR